MPQIDKKGEFNLNWALTKSPIIQQGHVDMEMLFDIGANESPCHLNHDIHDYFFQTFEDKYMQFVLSDRVVNCLMHSMEIQNMFNYTLSSANMLKDFGTNIKINAAFVSSAYPQILNQFG